MNGLFDLDQLSDRLRAYAQQEDFRPGAHRLLDETLVRGEVPRGDVERVTGLKERTARDLLGRLVEDGILGSDTPKGPVSLRFPIKAVETLFPRLFPEA
jgi:Fic family protein